MNICTKVLQKFLPNIIQQCTKWIKHKEVGFIPRTEVCFHIRKKKKKSCSPCYTYDHLKRCKKKMGKIIPNFKNKIFVMAEKFIDLIKSFNKTLKIIYHWMEDWMLPSRFTNKKEVMLALLLVTVLVEIPTSAGSNKIHK